MTETISFKIKRIYMYIIGFSLGKESTMLILTVSLHKQKHTQQVFAPTKYWWPIFQGL